MNKVRLLCYGDSNTWGYISRSDHQRYDKEKWNKLLENKIKEIYSRG